MKKYYIKEIFYSLQGEGALSGQPAVFCRFSGCNLWSGKEKDRATAICRFCDTDFSGTDGEEGGVYAKDELIRKFVDIWQSRSLPVRVIFTGGEPLLQLDDDLIEEAHRAGIYIALETNGTLPCPEGVDWICVSPKSNAPLKLLAGNELKVVFPQEGLDMDYLKSLDFDHHFVQPKDGEYLAENTARCLRYCMDNPSWKLSLQLHKILGID